MSAPWFELGYIGAGGAIAAALLIGIAFGWCLESAGMGNARKLAAQFYLTDFTVFKVMFSAILTAMLGLFWLGRLGALDLSRVYVPETYLIPQCIGGLVFGIGFAVGGLCPGTSCVAAVTGRLDGLAVVLGMWAGVLGTGLLYHMLRAFYESTPRGTLTIPAFLHLPYGVVVLVVVLVAIAGFSVAGRVESHSPTAMSMRVPNASPTAASVIVTNGVRV